MKYSSRDMFLNELMAASKAGDTKATEMAARIGKNELQVTAHSFTNTIFPGAVQTIRLYESSKVKTIGINNFSQGKPANNQMMLLTAIQVLAVELGATPTDALAAGANFGTIKAVTSLQNGEMDLFSDGKMILRDFPLQEFVTDGNTTKDMGTIHLTTPKFIYPDVEIKGEIRTLVATNSNLVLKIRLIGLCTQN